MSEQYVRVPRELLERVETWVQADCQALTELQALLAAPAEYVPAVVDEPVAWIRVAAKKWFYESFDDDLLAKMEQHKIIAQAEGFSVSVMAELQLEMEAAFRHVQRQVVMPEPEAFERLVIDHYGFGSSQLCLLSGKDLKTMFDACLDEFARLNK